MELSGGSGLFSRCDYWCVFGRSEKII